MKVAFISILAVLLAAPPSIAAPFLNKGKDESRMFGNWKPWQRRTVLAGTLLGAAGGGIAANRSDPKMTSLGVLGGGVAGFFTGALLVVAIDGVYFLWTGNHMEPWATFRFDFPTNGRKRMNA